MRGGLLLWHTVSRASAPFLYYPSAPDTVARGTAVAMRLLPEHAPPSSATSGGSVDKQTGVQIEGLPTAVPDTRTRQCRSCNQGRAQTTQGFKPRIRRRGRLGAGAPVSTADRRTFCQE